MNLSALGVTTNTQKKLEAKKLTTSDDILRLVPSEYIDLSNPILMASIEETRNALIKVKVISVKQFSGQYEIIKLIGVDREGTFISVTWFNQGYLYPSLSTFLNREILLYGKVSYSSEYGYQMTPPEIIEDAETLKDKVYVKRKKIQGVSTDMLSKITKQALIYSRENLEIPVLEKANLDSATKLYTMLHFPLTIAEAIKAKKQYIFRKLLHFAAVLKTTYPIQGDGIKLLPTVLEKEYIASLPYTLTEDQDKAIKKINKDIETGKRLRLLVQGDVGCGKTTVAIASLLRAAGNGFQSVMVAPTTVLAKQHYDALAKWFAEKGYSNNTIAYLSSETKAKEKREILKNIKDGKTLVVIGTHSVFSKDVVYKNLSVIVVDEEHKFGVEQRERLKEKADDGVHLISMSATPIPRTLATVLYGEGCEVINIGSMPNGRLPIKTAITNKREAMMKDLSRHLKDGRQAYVICPRVETDERTEKESVVDAAKMYEKYLAPNGYNISILHGKMKKEEIGKTIRDFRDGKTHVLISTTVVEVGVNVPNANYIIIENAEMFGLSSLHQLRGRVGRGQYQSYCVLFSNDLKNERLLVLQSTTNGFKIAEEDMRLRGTGNLIGVEQSGYNAEITMMLDNPDIYKEASKVAEFALKNGYTACLEQG